MKETSGPVEISVIMPAYNEEECVEGTLRELCGVLRKTGRSFEILAVDDGSTDGTPAVLKKVAAELPELRVIRLAPNSGQSAATKAGFRAARGGVLVTLDADGQNDPADIPRLLEQLDRCDVCCGYRGKRQDSFAKRAGSRLANAVRNRALKEQVRDTGCTLKAFRAEWARELPLEWRGMHRFLPTLLAMRGARIGEIPVRHRPRAAGRSKYTNWGRLKETIWDLWAVRWMQKRYRRFAVEEQA
ncbi:MAG TPA: glycosyltransferase family 2 protein [Kiritimatiellia bacterium]|nr:glycosyltransferase family 2 protein [Kiritimatiellia bacterium]